MTTLVIRLIVLSLIALCVVTYYVSGWDPLGVFSSSPSPAAVTQQTRPPTALAATDMAPQAQPSRAPVTPGAPSAANWWQVFFTDPLRINDPNNLAGSVTEQLIALIDQAQSTIDVAAFEFNLTPVAEALIAAKGRGVVVRWVTDNEYGLGSDGDADHGQFAMLKKAKIAVKSDTRSALMHNKFIIFDLQTVWTGSTNLTINGHFRNNNNVLVIQSPELAALYTAQFNEMWDGQFDPKSPSDPDGQTLTIRSTPLQVLFSPEDDVMPYLVSLIESAEKEITFMAFSYTHDDLLDAMLERFDAGVKVRGIFETRASETEYSALIPLLCAGADVRQDGNKYTFHHKVIIVDGRIVVTGSLNFSNNANDSNNENTIILMNSRIASQYLKEFDRRWAETVVVDDLPCP